MRISDWSSDVCSADLHHRVVGFGGAEELGLVAVRRLVHGVALAGEGFGYLPAQRRLVLGDQHPHRWPSRRSPASISGPSTDSSRPVRASYSRSILRPSGVSKIGRASWREKWGKYV